MTSLLGKVVSVSRHLAWYVDWRTGGGTVRPVA